MRKPSSFFGTKVIVFVVSAFIVWVVFSLLNNWVLDRASDHYLADGVVRIELPSGRKLNIPERYMYWEGFIKHGRWPRPKEGRVKVEAFNFDALLPDLRPFHQEDRAKWEALGYGDRVSGYIHESRETRQTIKSRFEYKMESVDNKYTVYIGEEGDFLVFANYQGQEGSVSPESKTYFTKDLNLRIHCNNLDLSIVSPGCNVWSFREDKSYLEYTYSSKYFYMWKEIHNGILDILKNFEKSADNDAQ